MGGGSATPVPGPPSRGSGAPSTGEAATFAAKTRRRPVSKRLRNERGQFETVLTDEILQGIIDLLKEGEFIAHACAKMGVDPSSLRRARRVDEELDREIVEAYEQRTAYLESLALRRAVYRSKSVAYKYRDPVTGDTITKQTKDDNALLLRVLERRSSAWRKNPPVEAPGALRREVEMTINKLDMVKVRDALEEACIPGFAREIEQGGETAGEAEGPEGPAEGGDTGGRGASSASNQGCPPDCGE